MGVYANGHLIYGFVHDTETEDLFAAIAEKAEEAKEESEEDEDEYEELSFDELHQDLCEKYQISLSSIGYESVDILSAFGANSSAKNFSYERLNTEDLTKTAEYDERIVAFLAALKIDPATNKPGWHLLGYMD